MTKQIPHHDSGQTWRIRELDDLELLRAEFTAHRFPRHYHDTFVIEVVESGEDEFFSGDGFYRARAGAIVVIPPGEVHTGCAFGPTPLRYRSFYPSERLLSLVFASSDAPSCRKFRFDGRVFADPALADALLRAHRGLEAPEESLAAERLLTLALTRLVTCYARIAPDLPGDRPEPDAVRVARDYLFDHVAENVSLHELASIVHLSPFHLLRVFRREVGLAPHEFVLNERIRRAKRLLHQGALISEVAYILGFADQSHFTRRFKQVVGVSPGQYASKRNFVQDNPPASVV